MSERSKKYEFTGETQSGLKQIRATRSFGEVGAGTLGGWIESERNLSHAGNCWIGELASVRGNARVLDNAEIDLCAEIYDNAKIYGDAIVSDGAHVFGNAEVFEKANIGGNAKVSGNARISGNAQVFDDAQVFGSSQILNNVYVNGKAVVSEGITSATNSFGTSVSLLPTPDGPRLSIVGEIFTFEKARYRWSVSEAGSPMAAEHLAIIDFLENVAKSKNA